MVRTPPPVTSLPGLCRPPPRPRSCCQRCPGEPPNSTTATHVARPSPRRVPCRSTRELTLERNPSLALFVEELLQRKAILRYLAPRAPRPAARRPLPPSPFTVGDACPRLAGEEGLARGLLHVADGGETRVPGGSGSWWGPGQAAAGRLSDRVE